MRKNWSYIRDEWLKSTTITEDDAKWALEVRVGLTLTTWDLLPIDSQYP